jgi:hypothetical protein
LRSVVCPYVRDIDAVKVAGRLRQYIIMLSLGEGISYFIRSMKVMQGRNFQSSFFNTFLLSNAISTSDLPVSRGYRERISSSKVMPPDFSTCSTVLISFSIEDLCWSSEERSRLLVILKVGLAGFEETQDL